MSNEPKVWISILDYEHVNIYSIGMNIPNVYDYPAYQASNLEYFANQKDKDVIAKNKELGSYGANIERLVQAFKKFPTSPDSLWLENDREELPKKSDYIFRVKGGGLVLNEACANVFKQFNLGESTLTPLKIHKLFTDELWLDDTFYFLNLCERREYLINPQLDERLEYHYKNYPTPFYNTFHDIEDNMLAVSQSVTECDVDIWHDPLFQSSYFMSDALHDALVQANMDSQWEMVSCQLV
ncbi:hypothetical protein IPZ60_02900 [Psychrobacter sp. NG25]|uniref:hypothetical protein n=1 Tax=Psychrobacter sp. NG25 TaxID=2782005 RepID=UPI0018833D9A|nr:hypothetical protein [Psychrobacter sp. NG25]MBF0657684.1 hypothetical protein [Psychrobacter sp. NG25]